MVNMHLQLKANGQSEPLWRIAVQSSCMWMTWALLTPIVLTLVRRAPLTTGRRFRGVAVHVAASVGLAAVFVGTIVLMMLVLDGDGESEMSRGDRVAQFATIFVWGVVLYWIVAAVGVAVDTARRVREQQARSTRLEAQLAEARLDALRSQLHPHFLFNTLNSISSLVRQSRNDDAVAMIGRLSRLLRETLRPQQGGEITLADELELVQEYLAIEQVRFGARLRTRLDVSPAAERALVPALLLQPIVENAVRHGLASCPEGGAIEVHGTVDDGHLVLRVENDGQAPPPDALERGNGVGLRNTMQRLETMYGRDCSVTLAQRAEGGGVAEMRLPLRFEDDRAGGGSV
jgi:two-component sensor histidine kinase